MGRKFFTTNFKVLAQKMTASSNKNRFRIVYISLYIHNSASKAPKCTKIWGDILEVCVNRS